MYRLFIIILSISILYTQSLSANDSRFEKELLQACKSKSGYITLDNQKFQLKLDIQTSEDPLIFVRVINSLLLVASVGIIPMCIQRDVSIGTNIGSTSYNFTQTTCIGWLVWSQDPKYEDVCEDFVDEKSDNIIFDLKDQGYIN